MLWDSDLARDKIHPELGAGWAAVLKEACCVKAGVHKDKVQRLRKKGDRGPLRLWPQYEVQFKNMVPTVSLLEWCGRRKYKPSTATFEATARGGDWEAIKWLRLKKCPWHQDHVGNACTGAAGGGHLDVLKWLRKDGCPWDLWTCEAAAKGGHLDVLKYAHENGCPWDENTCRNAAEGGHLDVLKYAHKNGCPWNEWTCAWAAMRGHLNVLKYARENGCPWNKQWCQSIAVEKEHDDTIIWILQQEE